MARRHFLCQARPVALTQNRVPWRDTSLACDPAESEAGQGSPVSSGVITEQAHPPPRTQGPPGAAAATRSSFPPKTLCDATSELKHSNLI